VYQRKITLDQESFKALASDTRIEILKRLDHSQRTVTDLANELHVNKSAVYKHLSRLLDAGLVKKVEDNRKWVYYRLSMKGANLLHPERVQIALMLSASLLALSLAVYNVYIYAVGAVEEAGGSGTPLTGPVGPLVTTHNVVLLGVGLGLIALSSALAFAAYRIRRDAAEIEPVL
jgi:DNA-binding transcriptional ArsR family regulator